MTVFTKREGLSSGRVRAAAARAAWLITALAAGLSCLLAGRAAHAAPKRFAIIVGYNGLPPGAPTELAPLRFADDDAARMVELARELGHEAQLLTTFDASTARRVGTLADEASRPTTAELERAVAAVRGQIGPAVDPKERPSVIIYFSGHGFALPDGRIALATADGIFDRTFLYERVLEPLAGAVIHLVIDACHAEAVVRPRDVDAATVEIDPAAALESLSRHTLDRYPHVGAVVASSVDALTHEWDGYGGGVFTHQVASGLRGAADVNHDERVEYSELAAFLSAANRDVEDPRARLTPIVRPPAQALRAALVTLSGSPLAGHLVGVPTSRERLWFDDGRGDRLADLRAEPGHRVHVVLPSRRRLFVRTAAGEGELSLEPGERRGWDLVRLRPPKARSRGPIESALRRGLFATPFGPAYYRGFVDAVTDMVPVPLDNRPPSDPTWAELVATADRERDPPAPTQSSWLRRPAPWTFAAAGAAGGASVLFGVRALKSHREYEEANGFERPSHEAARRFKTNASLAIGLAAASALGVFLGWYLD